MNTIFIKSLVICFSLVFTLAACSTAPSSAVEQQQPSPVTVKATRPVPTPTQIPMTWPSAKTYFAAYDPGTQRVLLIGRRFDTPDVWAYDAAAQTLTRLRDRRSGSFDCMVFDSKAGGVITNSQNLGNTWFYDPKLDEWKQLSSSKFAGISDLPVECPIAYDIESERVILTTGALGTTEGQFNLVTLSYNFDADVWEDVKVEQPVPPYVFAATMAYDSESDLVIYWDASVFKRVWSFDTNNAAWTEIPYTDGPDKGGGFGAMVYVPDLDRIYVYYMDQFFAYDANTNTWEMAAGELLPGSRTTQAMAYDPVARKIVVYGGMDENGALLDDLWLYDPQSGAWTEQPKP